jgi:hypothetical protein
MRDRASDDLDGGKDSSQKHRWRAGFEVIPPRSSQGRQSPRIKGCVAGGLHLFEVALDHPTHSIHLMVEAITCLTLARP